MTNAVNIAQSGSNNQTMRNRIINGAMAIDQRNNGSSITPTDGQYTLDRWRAQVSQASKLTIQQDAGAVTPPVGFTDYLGITSTSAYSVVGSDYFGVFQHIEGFNIADLAWGTASAQPVTVSFWVRSSLTGNLSGVIKNGSNSRAYPFLYAITSSNTWEYKTVTIPGDTTGTWNTTNGSGIAVLFSAGAGTSGSAAAGAWGAGNINGTTGAVSVVGTNGATLYITGVQLEEGTAASPFENRLYGTELALCQRYAIRYLGNSTYEKVPVTGLCLSSTQLTAAIILPVAMRASPSLSYSNIVLGTTVQAISPTSVSVDHTSTLAPSFNFLVASGLSAGQPAFVQANATTSAFLILNAEL
jgi:hypothetical protein